MDNTFVRDNQHDRYPVAAHVILTNPTSGHVLLMRRDGTDYGRNKLAFVAGHVDLGEKVTDCAVRETAEEIGVRIDADDLIPAGVMFRRSAESRVDFYFDFYFSVSRWTGHPQICEPQKCTELVWAAPDDLPHDVLDYVPRALANLQQERSFDEFGWEVPSVLPG